jgi:hypothetical protein
MASISIRASQRPAAWTNEPGDKKIVKKQKSVDAFPVFRLQARFHTQIHLHLTTAYEKEIHFAIRVF